MECVEKKGKSKRLGFEQPVAITSNADTELSHISPWWFSGCAIKPSFWALLSLCYANDNLSVPKHTPKHNPNHIQMLCSVMSLLAGARHRSIIVRFMICIRCGINEKRKWKNRTRMEVITKSMGRHVKHFSLHFPTRLAFPHSTMTELELASRGGTHRADNPTEDIHFINPKL